MFRRVAAVALLAAVSGGLVSGPAWAHNELVSSDPKSGAALAPTATAVTLTFTEAADPRFVQVSLARGADRVNGPKPAVSGTTVRQPVSALAAGTYKLAYRVVSQDGHPVQGSITFTVPAPASPAPPAKAPADGAAATAPDQAAAAGGKRVEIGPATQPVTSESSGQTRLLMYLVIALLCVSGIAAAGLHLVSARNTPKQGETG